MNQDDPVISGRRQYVAQVDPIEKVILSSMVEGVITVECDGTINMVNPSALRILGLVKSETVGRPFEDVLGPDNNPLRRLFSRVVHEGSHSLHEQIPYNRPDGQRIDLEVATSLLAFDVCVPGLESVVIVFRDVTAFKSLERARRKAADHLSHELKTPLAIIRASVERLGRTERSSATFDKILQRIDRNLLRLIEIQGIVEEILDPPPYRPAPCNLADRIRLVLDRIELEAAHREVSLSHDLEDLHLEIVDPAVLDTVVKTLVKNAIEATPDEGEVHVSLRSIDGKAILEVRDHGIGIPAGDEEFVFDGFHHIQDTEEYSSKRPYDFGAGGKGLELLRLKVLTEVFPFAIRLRSSRCIHIPSAGDQCPGRISQCPHVEDVEQCVRSSETTFTVTFSDRR
ncbi:MAG: ATP-binding protein [Thermodesulfobacteriota bacterium]